MSRFEAPELRVDAPLELGVERGGRVVGPTVASPSAPAPGDQPDPDRPRDEHRERLAAGASEAQIKAELVDQFGPGVLAEPPKSGFDLLAWLVPLGVLVAGAVGVGLIAWGWSRRRTDSEEATPAALDAELERRVDAELRRFES